MEVLGLNEVEVVSGGVDRPYDIVPDAQSEWGDILNDISNAAGNAGSKLGSWIYDKLHPRP